VKTVLVACLTIASFEAFAISRYDPTRMSCGQVRATIAREGAVILRYRSPRSGVVLYDRYVRSGRYCEPGEVRNRRSVPTADMRACPVYNCKQAEFDDPMRRFILPRD
jgi:hypothetical protein